MHLLKGIQTQYMHPNGSASRMGLLSCVKKLNLPWK